MIVQFRIIRLKGIMSKGGYFFRLFLLIFTMDFLVPVSSMSQDINFSMFKLNPIFLNPANTGNFYGNWRFAANYRNQWAATSAFTTASASMDKRFKIAGQSFAAGVIFLNDEAGVGGVSYNKLYGSLTYSNHFGKNYFYIGIQGGFVTGSVNNWYNWNSSTGDFSSPNGEENFGENTSYFDLNAGVVWKRKVHIFEPEIGFALSHINTPGNSFLSGTEEKEAIKYTMHIDILTHLSDQVYASPAFAYFGREGASLTLAGSDVGYKFTGNRTAVRTVYGGVYLRNGIFANIDALNFLIGSEIGRLKIGLSYDVNISDLGKSSGNNLGAFEVGIQYRIVGVVLNSYSIPCERY